MQHSSRGPKYSVVIATFNRESILRSCLDSLAVQVTSHSYEVVIVDDGSSDTTMKVVNEYVGRYPGVFGGCRQEHKGLAAAKNLGILASRGEMVVILDDDTIVPRDFLSRLDSFLARNDLDVVGFPDLPREDDGYLAKSARHLENFSRRFLVRDVRNRLKGNLAIKRSVFEITGLFDEARTYRMAEDTEFNYRVALAGARMAFTNELYFYHRSLSFREFVKNSYSKLGPKMLDVPDPARYYRVHFGLVTLLALVLIIVAGKPIMLLFASFVLLVFSIVVSLAGSGTPAYSLGIALISMTRLFFIILYTMSFLAMRTRALVTCS